MAEQKYLERTTGPSGWTMVDGVDVQLDGWELIEAQPDDPGNYRGRIRIGNSAVRVTTDTALRLYLYNADDTERVLDVTITHVNFYAPLWEFITNQ